METPFHQHQLLISLHNIEFAKEYNYFLTILLQTEDQKRRTDVSACVSNPVFTASVFQFPLSQNKINPQERLHIAAFVVTNRDIDKGEQEQQGQARLLGECLMDFSPFLNVLSEIGNTGVRRQLNFSRMQGDKEVIVGRLIVSLKLVGEQLMPDVQDLKPLELDEIFHELPRSDPFFNFSWRVRIDIRSMVDLPTNRVNTSRLPTAQAECAWTFSNNQIPDDFARTKTRPVESNRHPVFNQQLLITNPQTTKTKEGFIYICIRDNFVNNPLDEFYIPIALLTPFVPYNFEFQSNNQGVDFKSKYYISLLLEQPNTDSLIDPLVDVAVHMVNFDPLPYAKRMMVGMSLNEQIPDKINYIKVDLSGPANIAQMIALNSSDKRSCFLSTILQIPPYQIDPLYKAVAVFTILKSCLDKKVQFFIMSRDDSTPEGHSMPNQIVGYTDYCGETLKKLLFSDQTKNTHVPIIKWTQNKLQSVFMVTRCILDIGCFNQDTVKQKQQSDGGFSEHSQRSRPQTPADRLASQLGVKGFDNQSSGIDKYSILARELSQKQEYIHRVLKELDDKGESLKITGAEIVDLRRQIKLLQSENAILRKKSAAEEQLEVQNLITKEISMMNTEELRTKILRLAQAYRDERVRNEDFEKSLRNAQKEIAQSRQIQHDYEVLQKKYAENTKNMMYLQNEVQKTTVYKETIKKQERVISKLEKLMESTLKDTQKARQGQLELEQLKTENYQLQSKLKQGSDYDDSERLKKDIVKLERVIADLREELQSKRPVSSQGDMWEVEKMEYEIKLNKLNYRTDSLQLEMIENAKNYSKEIAQLKLVIAEKQAMLDTLTVNY